jgi:D-alanyl-D-alanine carboxypeptidase/D-alanyl-D-alanine-endopeptidase (penicillin-binding protein 4)
MRSLIGFIVATAFSLQAAETALSKEMLKIMEQPKYEHAVWGLYVKDLTTGDILHDLHGNQLFSPASTTKLFSVEVLLSTLGDDYRFKTPVYALGKVENGVIKGDAVLVAQGDLTFGGRQTDPNTITFTKLDHVNANEVPGVSLTPQDPLTAIRDLAKQIAAKGIKEIQGDVLIDDNLFETIPKRGFVLSPIFINENLIDIVINPAAVGEAAKITWRPIVPGYEVVNELVTATKGEPLAIEISSDEKGQRIVVSGKVPEGQKDLVRTFSIKDPKAFAKAALVKALQDAGVKVSSVGGGAGSVKPGTNYRNLEPLAEWVSPPLSEYGKLILKVSHNIGADLIPLLLAAHEGNKSFDSGMLLIGGFLTQQVKLSPNEFVLGDAAGGNDNRFTPKGEVQLLEYVHRQSPERFKKYFDALPILGVDGSLEDFAKGTPSVGKVRAKPGTGVGMNLATGKLFLITQALGGYVEAKNGHLYAYMLVVNNATMPTIDDVFPIFEDVSMLSNQIYIESK